MASSLVKMRKDLSKVFDQRVKEDSFNRTGKPVVDVPFASSLGETHMSPVSSLIAGSFESFAIHKGLQEGDRMVVDFLPVSWEDSRHCPQEVRCQMGNLDPGKDEEAGVVDDEVEVVLSLVSGPADEAVAWGDGPGGGAKSEGGQEVQSVPARLLRPAR